MPAGTVTALQAQALDPQRVNLFIDGTFALGISLTTLAREQLYVGKVLQAEEYERLERAEQAHRAVRVAMRAIEARPRSTQELRERLKRKGFDEDLIEAAIERLQDLGLVDDAAFARFWVESRQNGRARGPSALRDELRRKGVASQVIATTLEDDELVGDQAAQAEQIARQAVRRYANSPDYQTFARRMAGLLQRRGFSFDTIRPIIAKLWREHNQSGDEE